MANNILNQLIAQSLFKANPQLRGIPFDPAGSGYDYETAINAGMGAGADQHWGSRVELNEAIAQSLGLPAGSGIMLKGATHPTWDKALAGEEQAGFGVTKGADGRYYSIPQENLRPDNTLKAKGFFGSLPRPDGSSSTEISVGMPINGKETLMPSLVPTLDTEEVDQLLSQDPSSPIPRQILGKALSFARDRIAQGLSPFASNNEIPYGIKLPDSGKSQAHQADQRMMARAASEAGLPNFIGNEQDSSARLRLMDAIKRSEASGFKVPHFIGQANEPTGDRGVTMDIENLVKALQAQQSAALKDGDKKLFDKIGKEKAFWEKEVADGMSAEEWRKQTGQGDPLRK